MSPGEEMIHTAIGSLGALMTAMLTGWFNTFVAPFWTIVAGWFGLA